MTIKVYISGICGSQEVRKLQQRVLFILQSLPIDLQVIDVTEPGKGEDLIFMQDTAKKHNKKTQLPPQIFNDNDYCGDYADFELANDDDEIMKFLKLESGPSKAEILKSGDTITQNGIGTHENDKEISETQETVNTTEVGELDANDSNVILNSEEKTAENETTPDAGEGEQRVSESNETKEEVPSDEEESEEEESE